MLTFNVVNEQESSGIPSLFLFLINYNPFPCIDHDTVRDEMSFQVPIDDTGILLSDLSACAGSERLSFRYQDVSIIPIWVSAKRKFTLIEGSPFLTAIFLDTFCFFVF